MVIKFREDGSQLSFLVVEGKDTVGTVRGRFTPPFRHGCAIGKKPTAGPSRHGFILRASVNDGGFLFRNDPAMAGSSMAEIIKGSARSGRLPFLDPRRRPLDRDWGFLTNLIARA